MLQDQDVLLARVLQEQERAFHSYMEATKSANIIFWGFFLSPSNAPPPSLPPPPLTCLQPAAGGECIATPYWAAFGIQKYSLPPPPSNEQGVSASTKLMHMVSQQCEPLISKSESSVRARRK